MSGLWVQAGCQRQEHFWCQPLRQGQVRASTGDSCVLEGGPWVSQGPESPTPARTQGHGQGVAVCPRHLFPSPLSCGQLFLAAPRRPLLCPPHSAGQGLPAGCGPAWFLQLLPRAPAPPNHVTVALGDGISAVTPPSADWGEGDSGFRSSSEGEPGQYREFCKHLLPS